MLDNKISALTMSFLLKDSLLSYRNIRHRNRNNFIRNFTMRCFFIFLFLLVTSGAHYINNVNSTLVYAACCTVYILVKK